MKSIVGLIITTLLFGCTVSKWPKEEKINQIKGAEWFRLINKQIFVDVEIENNKTRFMLDTGSRVSAAIDTTIIPNFCQRKFLQGGLLKSADDRMIRHSVFLASVKSNLFKSYNKALAYIKMPIVSCNTFNRNCSGILGLDFFVNNKFPTCIDFTNNKICNLSKNHFEQLLKSKNFVPIKSYCQSNQIVVFLLIGGHELPFKLDTGYSGSILMPNKKNLVLKHRTKTEYSGSFFQTATSITSGVEYIFDGVQISFGGQDFTSKVNVSTTIKTQSIGVSLIQCFDWLIDYSNNKVYIKKNQNNFQDFYKRQFAYATLVQNGKLVISCKEKSQTKFQVGDQITSFNGTKISAENLCQIMELLNKTDDWSSFNLEIIPVKRNF
ncbi:hypothetical protein KIH23_02225 [Flavobacterium sp. CYK-55]|uniref:PDZ domain-containing protein n=1 Tax=Flavobacterium sp. CYK-55 TaxID=2835529 RepID=UPI001BCBF24B|nr:PDZ domain-containing protein [Flavobacterium sp. CYK-55]MBS7786100.1 hypothetical protein [Flavobacterium sp. CYK-55]